MQKAVIIDDEPDCVKLLSLQLKMYCPEVRVVAECRSSEEGLLRIRETDPDLVFLDIEMPVMNGFQLLEKLGDLKMNVVFVTAYDQFAVKAFRYAAIDYLLKPIDAKELVAAVARCARVSVTGKEQIRMLKQQMLQGTGSFPNKIALPYQNGVGFVEVDNILYCESANNYTRFFTVDGKEFLVSKTLGDIQEILEERNFLRVHRQFLINLAHIKKYVRGDGNYLVLTNEQQIPVARKQKEKLMRQFGWL